MKKIIFMGTPNFSVSVLEGLIKQDKDFQIVAVVTQPDKPVGRKKVLTAPPVKEKAMEYNIPIYQPNNLKDQGVIDELKSYQPDLIVTAAFGQFLPDDVLNLAPFGVLNVHASLLPKYRGGAPIHEAIIQGDTKTGITIMKTIAKMDAGDIISQAEITIEDTDNVGTMFEKLSVLGTELLLDTLPKYFDHQIVPVSQDENQATYAPNITKEMEVINWNNTAKAIWCKIRGMNPWPVAHTTWKDKRLKIYQATVIKDESFEQSEVAPGTIILREKNKLWISCKDQTILSLDEVQLAGKSKMTIAEFLNGSGQQMQVGDILE